MNMWDNFGFPESAEGSGVKDDDGQELDDITNDLPYGDDPEQEPASKEIEEELEEQEEGTEEEEEVEEEEQPEASEEDGEFSYKPFLDTLAESGVIKYDEEKEYEDSEEGLLEVFKDNARIQLEEEIAQYGPDFQRLLEVARAGGDVKEAFEDFQSSPYNSLDLNDADAREGFLKEYYETIGLDEELITEKLEALESAGEQAVIQEAKIAQKYMNKLDERRKEEYVNSLKAEKEAEVEAQRSAVSSLKEMIESTDELNGFALTRDVQKRLFEHITKPVTKDGKTQLMLNRLDSKKQLFAAYLDMIDYDVNKLDKQAMTKATRNLRSTVMGFKPKTPKGSNTTTARPTKKIPRGIWDARREIED